MSLTNGGRHARVRQKERDILGNREWNGSR